MLQAESLLRTRKMAAAESATIAVVKGVWPIVVVVAGGLVAWGSLRSDVKHVMTQQDQYVSDHDTITRMNERQARMETDINEMKNDIKEIAKAVK